MRFLLFISILIMLASCSKSSSTFSIVCDGGIYDEAFTFNLDTGDVERSQSLTKIGTKLKIAMSKSMDAKLESGEISKEDYDIQYKIWEGTYAEKNSKMVIRNVTDGFITFAKRIEKDGDLGDTEITLNRASLQLKKVTTLSEILARHSPEEFGEEFVSFLDCEKPNI